MINLNKLLSFPLKTYLNHINTFHLVNISPWPILVRIISINCFISILVLFKEIKSHLIGVNMLIITVIALLWWRDVDREASIIGEHTKFTYSLIITGIILFILSEVMFFVSFFWSFFHNSLNPGLELGIQWPPAGVYRINPYEAPLLNSILLVSRGVTLTYSHFRLLRINFNKAKRMLIITLMLGLLFTLTQLIEYIEASFTIIDSVYGSIFFIRTGFHGIHVIIGALFLIYSLTRITNYKLRKENHSGFNNRAWYWHFVDVVWLILYLLIYWWTK